MRCLLYFVFLLCCGAALRSAETLPPVPRLHFNDYAMVVSPAVAEKLNGRLEDFERETSTQVLVAVFPQMLSASSLEDFTHRTMENWKVGQRSKNNGVVVFVFIAERTARIEVNYGLEGALPDALAKRIIEDEMLPYFRNGDYAGGLAAGLGAIQLAIRGEYQGDGGSSAAKKAPWWSALFYLVPLVFLLLVVFLRRRVLGGGTVYDRSGSHPYATGLFLGLLGGILGGSASGGGGGFSGGGGSGGGGGASGRW